MLKIAIIDDDYEFCRKLSSLLNFYFSRVEIAIYDSDFEKVLEEEYAICFFDIYLNSHNGMELANKYNQKHGSAKIVFVSSCDDIIHDTLMYEFFCSLRKEYLNSDIDTFYKKYNFYILPTKKIGILHDRIKVQIEEKDIIYIESHRNKIDIYTKKMKLQTYNSMKEILEKIDSERIVRINQHQSVNLRYVLNIQGKKMTIINNKSFIISRKQYNFVLDKYLSLMFEIM